MILVAIDSHSKWIEAIPVRHVTAQLTVTSLREIFSRLGIPRTIVTDNGTQFTSETFTKFLTGNNIKHFLTAPYHPQSNGLAERAVRTLKDGLKKVRSGDLSERLAKLLFSYRRTPLDDGRSPSQRLLGYQIRSRLDTCLPPPVTFPIYPQADQENKLSPGTPIWARNFGQGERWLPATVKETRGSRMITVETAEGELQRHMDQVRPRYCPVPAQPSQDQPAGVPTLPEEAQPAVLRRSTRMRKSVQRYSP
nr:uncharacterized protein K02A2.6-like [Dermacentor andersoni]